MGLYRQGEKDQGARIGRLEQYVYDFHGRPSTAQSTVSATTNKPNKPNKPLVKPIVPSAVPANTPLLSGGQVPFSGDAQFLANINMFGSSPAIEFLNPGGSQEISGLGKNGVGKWSIGIPVPGMSSVFIVNHMHGANGARLELTDNSELVVSDRLTIEDERVGGGKDTLVLRAKGFVNNVGIQFQEDTITEWELFKTGKNHLMLNKRNKKSDILNPSFDTVLDIDKVGVFGFSKNPTVINDPVNDNELVNLRYLKNYVTSGGVSGAVGSVFSPGGEITAVDKITVEGMNNSTVILKGVNQQYFGGVSNSKSWGIGKLSPLKQDVEIYNRTGTKTSSITLRSDGDIQTENNLIVGDETSDAVITLLANNVTNKCDVEFESVGSIKGRVGLVKDDLVIESKVGDIYFYLTPGKSIFVENGHSTEKVMTTESGQITNRPTANLVVGQQFLDLTLKKPIWLYQVTPPVWIDALGTNV